MVHDLDGKQRKAILEMEGEFHPGLGDGLACVEV